jgi:hypothetical protein
MSAFEGKADIGWTDLEPVQHVHPAFLFRSRCWPVLFKASPSALCQRGK